MIKKKTNSAIFPSVDVPEISSKTGVKKMPIFYLADIAKIMKETVKIAQEFGAQEVTKMKAIWMKMEVMTKLLTLLSTFSLLDSP